jgi:hypothetical protein
MSYVIAAPEMMATAATDLAGIGSDLSAAHAAAAPTVGLIPAAADEISAAITKMFSGYAHAFQGLTAKAAAFHEEFAQTLKAGATTYSHAEAAAASSLNGISLATMILNDLDAVAVPLHQWFLTWPASIQGFVNDITYPLEAITAFVVIFGVILGAELLILLAPLGL